MHQHFPQEILKQLDMNYKPSLTWLQTFGTIPADTVELTFHRIMSFNMSNVVRLRVRRFLSGSNHAAVI